MLKALDRLIVFFVIILVAVFFSRFFLTNCIAPTIVIKKVSVPEKLYPDSYFTKRKISNIEVSLERKRNAQYFFVEACSKIDNCDFLAAQQFTHQAIAEDPTNRRYFKIAELVRVEIDNRKTMDSIIKLVQLQKFDDAWGRYEEACRDNYTFFSRYSEEFAQMLLRNKYTASASSILEALN